MIVIVYVSNEQHSVGLDVVHSGGGDAGELRHCVCRAAFAEQGGWHQCGASSTPDERRVDCVAQTIGHILVDGRIAGGGRYATVHSECRLLYCVPRCVHVVGVLQRAGPRFCTGLPGGARVFGRAFDDVLGVPNAGATENVSRQ